MASIAVPNKFYKIRRVAKDNKNRHSRLMEAAKDLAQLAVNDGDEETFKHAHARILQATKEVQDMIQEKTGSSPSPSNQVSINQVPYGSSGDDAEDDLTLAQLAMRGEVIPQPPQIQVRNRKQRSQANSSNNSRLGHGTQGG